MKNYGVYFQEEGEKILNIIKTLLMNIIQYEPSNSKLIKEATNCLKTAKELTEEFTKISNKNFKYNKQRIGGKYSYLYNEDQGDVVDMLQKRKKSPFSQVSPDISSKSLKHFSIFS